MAIRAQMPCDTGIGEMQLSRLSESYFIKGYTPGGWMLPQENIKN